MKKIIPIIVIILLIVTGCLVIFNNQNNTQNNNENKTTKKVEQKEEEKEENYSLSMFMVGDVIAYKSIMNEAYSNGSYNFDYVLRNFKNIVSNYDLAYYNQESILGGAELGLSAYPRFNSPVELGKSFVDAGFNLVSLANNHTLDRGTSAINNSVNFWKTQTNVVTNGSHTEVEQPKIYEKNNIKYAFLSYTTLTNGLSPEYDYQVDRWSEEKAKKDIEAVKDADIIIVAMHWGTEYTYSPVKEQKEIAQFLADQGVKIIIGTHSHCVEPIEFIGDTLVMYSLGNFLACQREIETDKGMLTTGLAVELKINKNVKGDNTTITLSDVGIDLTYYDYTNNYRNYVIYPYGMLTNSILNGHEERREYFEKIVLNGLDGINTRFMDKYIS